MNTTKKLGGLAAGVLLSSGLLIGTVAQNVQAHGGAQDVTVTITSKGYSPASINVKGGQKVHMTFVSKSGGCGNAVKIPALKKTFTLKKGQKKSIAFTPRKGQTINFACSMDMYKGKVTAK